MVVEWKPIADAPQDGTRLLLGSTPTGSDRQWPGWVDLGKWIDDGAFGAGWYGTDVDRDGDRLECEPTHWDFAPEPPRG